MHAIVPTADERAAAPCNALPLQNVCYAYDGTPEGLLTAVFTAIASKDADPDIVEDGLVQPRLDQSVRYLATDARCADRVRRLIVRAGGMQAFSQVISASLSDDPDKGRAVFDLAAFAASLPALASCRGCARRKTCDSFARCPHNTRHRRTAGLDVALEDLSHPHVGAVARLDRAVMNERHRMKQFIRFEHAEGDVYFARCNPKANVLPLVIDWFAARFNTQRFVIYDENHHVAALFDGTRSTFVRTDDLPVPAAAEDETVMRKAWKTFYAVASIEARYHPELRVSFMPKRLWKNILEVAEPLDYEPARMRRLAGDTPDELPAPPSELPAAASCDATGLEMAAELEPAAGQKTGELAAPAATPATD
ncbi:DUF4130 domain-containing protein [Eggerthellaceae bacterium zg-887]|uniref:TIGR03915 family putative DNA repair protein n=1 Tax=Xiamenia xianingshaonis TaxID=2682776 RepID=UPI00140D1757|nr:TIGR03915 family putative DNA repair protein [Xiamenia xianingshaonis]NHM15926.1 DUF4130 domain-containing protein [Xiamenia xianingshaonis]